MSRPLASAQRWADAGPMRRSGICPASGRCRANIWADVGPMPGKCQADANAYPTIIADSIHVYIGPTSARHRPDISPTSAQHRPNISRCQHLPNNYSRLHTCIHRPNIGPTSAQHRSNIGPRLAQHRPNAGQMLDQHRSKAWQMQHKLWPNAGPALVQFLTSDMVLSAQLTI